LFGLEFAECRFRKAVEASQLDSFLDEFPRGWKTRIGDRKGMPLSRGLKA